MEDLKMNASDNIQNITSIQPSYPLSTQEPQATSQQTPEVNGQLVTPKKIFITKYIKEKSEENNFHILTHGNWERRLWIANCFIIPMIVYPILSLFGHLLIAILNHPKTDKYIQIKDYLDDNCSLLTEKNNVIALNENQKKTILDILTNCGEDTSKDQNPLFDTQTEVIRDPLYQLLTSNDCQNHNVELIYEA